MAQLFLERDITQIPRSLLTEAVNDYAKWLLFRGDAVGADKRELTEFRIFDCMRGRGFNSFYVIKKGAFVAITMITIVDDEIFRRSFELISLVRDRIIEACRMAEAEWAAYWKSDLWC